MLDGWPGRASLEPLTPAEATTFLQDGGYELSVRRCPSGRLRLNGPGIGSGVPLGDTPSWVDLFRALVRLRCTRRTHDLAWLDRMTRFLECEREETPAWISVPAPRVERLTASTDLPEPARRYLDQSRSEDGSMRLPKTTTTAQPGIRLQRMDPERARRQLHGWNRLATAMDTDPVLRMYCAGRSAALLIDTATGAAVIQVTEPSPAHPGYPGGTLAVGLPSLRSGLLRQIIENRFERRENELGYFLEHFVRPLLRTFRLALDTHHVALNCLDQWGVDFELSPELQSTGRVVIHDHARIREPRQDEVEAGVRALLGTLDALSATFSGIRFDGEEPFGGRVRMAVDRVIAEELRHLQQHTAELLSGQRQRLNGVAHTVPREQDEVLKGVLRTVQERTRTRRRDPRIPRPAVVIDLDLCGIVPLQRTLDAARAVAGPRPGAPDGVAELAFPTALATLPTFAESTWRNFIEANGLDVRYPEVDWHQVYREFFQAFGRPWENLRTDTVNAGLARFVWDVQDAGGRVVFCTGRRERVRRYTEEVLADGGVPDTLLVCMPDIRTRPISELKVEKLRELGELDIVAIFDDILANRIALTKEFRGARAVAVELPGMATERQAGQPVADRAPVIANFETIPRPAAGPNLSNTHSLEELQLGALRHNRPAKRWAVRVSEQDTRRIVESVLSDADLAAARTAQRARIKAGLDEPHDVNEHQDRIIQALHHVFTRKQFLKGSRSNYRCHHMRQDALPFVREGKPIEVVLLGFPVKQCLNRLKAFGPLPDLAEFGSLARLRELGQAVRSIYPPGVRFNILTDGRHFRPRPAAVTEAYSRKIREYVELVGIAGCVSVEEIDVVAQRKLGADLPSRRSELIGYYRERLEQALAGFDIADNPLRTLRQVEESLPEDPPFGLFRDMLMSVVYSVPVSFPRGVNQLAWSSLVYSDLYNLTDRGVSEAVRRTRLAILRHAWHTVIRYLATLRVDEDLGYEELFPHRVRLTVSAVRPGRCGFTYLGGSGLLPWQGTGVVERRGQLAVDFAVALLDQGFLPVYSPLLGPRQPWMMVPAQYTHASRHGLQLDPDLITHVRLRRK